MLALALLWYGLVWFGWCLRSFHDDAFEAVCLINHHGMNTFVCLAFGLLCSMLFDVVSFESLYLILLMLSSYF